MGSGEADLLDDDGGGGDARVTFAFSAITCSICLEVVKANGDRSTARLQCGHEFHLDCIGSAFNAKGLMQCPNCRKIEKGQWLYANGCRSLREINMDDWTHDEDLYDLNYSEMPFGVHWCPFSGLTRLPPPFEEGESPSTAYHDFSAHHAVFAEPPAVSLLAHSCPYAAFFQPLQPLFSNSAENAVDSFTFHHHWNGLPGTNEMPTSHAFPRVDLHYHSWEQHSSFPPVGNHMNGPDSSVAVRSSAVDSDGLPRGGSFIDPYLMNHGTGSRPGSSVISSMVLPYPGNSRAHFRTRGRLMYQQQNSVGVGASSIRRPNVVRGTPPVGPALSLSSDHSSLYHFPPPGSSARSLQDAEGSGGNHFYTWERDRLVPFPADREPAWWGPFAGGSDSGSRGSIWQRHGSDRLSSQGWTESSSHQSIHPPQMHPFI